MHRLHHETAVTAAPFWPRGERHARRLVENLGDAAIVLRAAFWFRAEVLSGRTTRWRQGAHRGSVRLVFGVRRPGPLRIVPGVSYSVAIVPQRPCLLVDHTSKLYRYLLRCMRDVAVMGTNLRGRA